MGCPEIRANRNIGWESGSVESRHLYVAELVPRFVARENRILAVAGTPDSLIVAVAAPTDTETIEKLRFILNRRIQVIHVTSTWLDSQLCQRYGDENDDPMA